MEEHTYIYIIAFLITCSEHACGHAMTVGACGFSLPFLCPFFYFEQILRFKEIG